MKKILYTKEFGKLDISNHNQVRFVLLYYICNGKSRKEIRELLNLSETTSERLFRKFLNEEEFNILKENSKIVRRNKLKINSAFNNPEVKERIKKTNLKLYGSENIFGSEYGKKKVKETLLEKYNVENPSQIYYVRKSKTKEKPIKLTSKERWFEKHNIEEYTKNNKLKLLSTLEEIYDTGSVKYECIKCHKLFERDRYLVVKFNNDCPYCKRGVYRNKTERIIVHILKQYNIKCYHGQYIKSKTLGKSYTPCGYNKETNRPFEGDIIIPKNSDSPELGGIILEINDFRTHCLNPLYNKTKEYHKNKTEEAWKFGYELYHLWENMSLEEIIQFIKLKLGIISEYRKFDFSQKEIIVDRDLCPNLEYNEYTRNEYVLDKNYFKYKVLYYVSNNKLLRKGVYTKEELNEMGILESQFEELKIYPVYNSGLFRYYKKLSFVCDKY